MMETEPAVKAHLQQVVQKRGLQEKVHIISGQMATLKGRCKSMIEQIEEYEQREYSGKWVLLTGKGDNDWEFVAIIDPDDEKWCDEELPPFTLIMPIPKPDTVPEWDGF